MKNLDVWAIQYYPEELYNALNNINDGLNIIYSNVKSDLYIGKEKVKSRQFDTILYNEESDILIMLARAGIANKEDVIKYLDSNGKRYVEIDFDYRIFDYKEKYNVPEIWFSRERYVLEDAIQDSLNKGITKAKFYPCIKSELKLGFLSRYHKYINLDSINFKGLLQLEDKIVLIVNEKNNVDKFGKSRNMGALDVLDVIDNFGISCDVIYDRDPKIYIEETPKKLILRK